MDAVVRPVKPSGKFSLVGEAIITIVIIQIMVVIMMIWTVGLDTIVNLSIMIFSNPP